MEVQTRDGDGAIIQFKSLEQAFDYADKNENVWKVSFKVEDGSRARFVRSSIYGGAVACWVFDPIIIDDK